jgi:hypothetical protein
MENLLNKIGVRHFSAVTNRLGAQVSSLFKGNGDKSPYSILFSFFVQQCSRIFH